MNQHSENPEPENSSEGKDFGIGFVATIFDRTVEWVRWTESQDLFTYDDGSPIAPRRTELPHARYGYRRYTLSQIGDMADSLFRKNKLTVTEHRVIKTRVESYRLGRKSL